MKMFKNISASVLVYTMVLVVLGVFMATVVLNVATELSIEYEKRNIEVSLVSMIKTKGDLSMKYARDTNKTGSGFVDIVRCPTSITMSGTITPAATFATVLTYASGAVSCQGTYNGNILQISFSPLFTDLAFAEYLGQQIPLNNTTQTGIFSDPDNSSLSAIASYPLAADGIDDNFDSDNFSAYSTGSIKYPNGYSDNDDDARRMMYGYVIENSGLYNIFWSNTAMKQYISDNTQNTYSEYIRLGSTNSGYLNLDINSSFRLVLYKINAAQYNLTKEFIIDEIRMGTGETASIGYLQNDLSLSPVKTGTGDYIFDFVNNDYALFVENTSSGALLYQLRGEQQTTGSGIYINPLKDQDISVFGYLGSHVLIDDEGRLIGDQFEIFGLK